MRLLKSPNSWSCLPTAFAMACNVSLREFLELVGHDGSENVFSGPRPQVAFHIQECYEAALILGYLCTPLDFKITSSPDGVQRHVLYRDLIVLSVMSKMNGVLLGMGKNCRHATAWDTKQIYDPAGRFYDFKNQFFTPETFIIVKSI